MSGNRFQKNHPKIDPNDPAVLLTSGIQVEPEQVSEKEEEKEVEVREKKSVKGVAKENPLAGLIDNKKPERKTASFLLTVEIIDKLEKVAKQNKCSRSQALEALLRSIL